MRIGYGKIGRSLPLDRSKWGFAGGDDEPPLVLDLLARRHPDDEFILFSRNSGERMEDLGFPPNVTNFWADHKLPKKMTPAEAMAWYDEHVLPLCRTFDGLVVWTGQHGTSNSPIPPVGKDWPEVTSPQTSFIFYASLVVRGINAFRQADPLNREEVWLCPDPRNYVKARDLKWPCRHPVLGQYDWSRIHKAERYNDFRTPEECGFVAEMESPHVWTYEHAYEYSRLEISGVLPHMIDSTFLLNWSERQRFGLFIGEARAYVKWNRLDAMRDWVLPLGPDFIHGKWTEKSLQELGIDIKPAPWDDYYPTLRSVRSTFTTPSSGSGWATTKPWQAFAVGTICFFHPQYDTQHNILRDADPTLREWLLVDTPEQLARRVDAVNESEETWRWLATKQREHYDKACEELTFVRKIEDRIWTP